MEDSNDNGSGSQAGETAIAVVGLALRFPGAPDARRFWSNLAAGVESITILDAGQRAKAGLPSGEGWVAAGGEVEGLDAFDAAFFGYTPGEAEQMDPQQRFFLECAWAAIESAGYAPGVGPIRAGVYAGASLSTYLFSNVLPALGRGSEGLGEGALGNGLDYLATRAAYELDLTGPCVTVQSACSTSLVAVHCACQALLAGECGLALAGGVSVRDPQVRAYRYQEGGIYSPDGHCRAFDAAGAGTVGGNGVGVVVLKRLSNALKDRDPIRAVILGTAINNDGGAKPGYAAPSVAGQAAVISEALAVAGVEPGSISYIEAHGTGTPLGDPIEVAALKQVFRGAPGGSIGLGAVKSNLGHLDAAAGIAGLIKTVLALENRLLPPSLHFVEPNPRLGLEDSPLYVVARPRPWSGPAPRRAGVSAFGIGGTNAHVVLEEAPVPVPGDEPRRDEELLLLSAKSETALDRMTAGLAEHLGDRGERLSDVAHTLQVGRARFAHRRFVIAGSPGEAAARLAGGGGAPARTAFDEVERRGAVFLFPGGGAQRVNMGAGFLREPAFREAIDRCADLVRGQLGGDLRQVLFAGPERCDAASRELDRPLWSQPALFACDWALAQLWLSWGVRPEALLGHSLGEYVAACLAGVFSLEDALSLVLARGRIMEQLPPGAMVSVLAPVADLEPLLGAELSVAAINGPSSSVISGPLDAIEALERELVARGLELKRVRYPRAAHSAMLDPYLDDFAQVVGRVALEPPALPVVSNATGRWLGGEEATDPGYWVRHLRETVRFSEGLAFLLSVEARALIEVGPGSILTSLARQHPARTSQPVVATLPGSSGEPASPLAPLGEAWLAGVTIDWERYRAGERRRRVPLPTYGFDRERYWLGPAAAPRPPPAPRKSTLRASPPAPPRNETERMLVGCFREVFRLAEVGLHDDFFALGGDSLLALRLTAELTRRFGVRLPLKAVVESPTAAALAERITAVTAGAPPAGADCLLRLQEGSRGLPLFCIHGVRGQSLSFRELARRIDPARPVYAFESAGLDERGPLHTSVGEMAAYYLEVLRAVQPEGPYLLLGMSFGGAIAYEMARRLSAGGHAVPLCALLDTPGPEGLPAWSGDEAELLSGLVADQVAVPPERLRGLPSDAQLQVVLDEGARVGGELFSDLERGRRLLRVWKANLAALYRYPVPRWEGGELQYFRAAERDPRQPAPPELAWIGRGAAVRVEVVPGAHLTMLESPHVEVLAARLRACLDRAEAEEDARQRAMSAASVARGEGQDAL